MYEVFFLAVLISLYDVPPYTYSILWLLCLLAMHNMRWIHIMMPLLEALYCLIIYLSVEVDNIPYVALPLCIFGMLSLALLINILIYDISDPFMMMICISFLTRYIVTKYKVYTICFFVFLPFTNTYTYGNLPHHM